MAVAAVLAGALGSLVIGPAKAATFRVVTTNDAGPGSLRDAITSANASPGLDTITFAIEVPIGSPLAINVLTPLPPITDPVLVDGATQPEFVAGGPPVVIVRNAAAQPIDGFVVAAGGSGSTIRDLSVVGFQNGILLQGATGTTIADNLLGLRPSGAVEPNVNGLTLDAGSDGNLVTGNTISGNTGAGLALDQSNANRIVSNRVGTDRAGAVAVPNGGPGVSLTGGAALNDIGVAGAGNVISGNAGAGVSLANASTNPGTANTVAGNRIGTDATGSFALGNSIGVSASSSVAVIGGAAAGAGNVISGNPGGGLHADLFGLNGFVVKGNFIGTNAAGTGVLPNGLNGVSLSGGSGHAIGGPAAGEGNLISGNARGVDVDNASGVTIQGNFIGTDVTGTSALGNSAGGIQVADGRGYVIGGAGAGAGNVVSGNAGFGVRAICNGEAPRPTSATVAGNRIGTNAAGTAAVPNTGEGVVLDACLGPTTVSGNVVSGNTGAGVFSAALGASISGNLIGTDAAGTAAVGNGGAGVVLAGSNTALGGVTAGAGNTIAYNAGAGVLVTGLTGNAIRGNSIHDNGGLGIDLVGSPGVTPNDAGDVDIGPNLLQNFPVLTQATAGAPATVGGTLQSTPGMTFTVDLYASAACDASGFGEGQTYLTSVAVTTDGAGVATFSTPVTVAVGQVVTATATDPSGNTSEFSACLAVIAPPGISIADVSVSEGAGAALVTVSLPAPSAQDVSVTLTTADGTATAPSDYIATTRTVVIPAGQQSVTVAVPIVADAVDENDETFTVTLSNPVGGVLGVSQGTVTIVDDDGAPTVSVSDAVVLEGSAGTSVMTFTARLSAPSDRPVSVTVTSADGTATAGSDYAPLAVTVVIPAGATTATFGVTVFGDTVPEPDEYFFLSLGPVTNAVVVDPTAVGVIASDDAPVAPTTTTITTTTTTTRPSTSTSTTGPQTRIISISPTTTAPETRILIITPGTTTTLPPTIVVTATLPPPPTTTLAPTTTVAPTTTPAPTTTVPPTTTTPSTTTVPPTTVTSTSTPAPTTTPTTAAPTTTSRRPPVTSTVPAGPSTLVAVSSDGTPKGPPGVGLDVSGAGYAGCTTVYFYFDGVRVGSAHPDAAGEVSARGLSIPGDADAGDRRVTSACESDGTPQRAQTPFAVERADVHRPAFLTALPEPRQVSTDARAIITSAIVAAALLLLLAFPSQLFNATFTENYDEIRGWFRLPRRVLGSIGARRQFPAFALFAVVGGFIYSLLSPDFGLNGASLALLVGMTVAVMVITVGFFIPSSVYMRRRYGEWGRISVLPGSLVVGVVCVALSRLLHFQPGYLYGVLAAVVFAQTLREREQGHISALTAAFVLAVSLAAWFLRVPVSAAAAEPGAGAWLIALEACLGAIFLLGLESVVVGLLPMRFLDGSKVLAWSRPAWAVLFTLGLFALVHVLLTPGSGYVGHTTGGVTIAVVVLYLVFGAISVGFWAYFRYRPERWAPRP